MTTLERLKARWAANDLWHLHHDGPCPPGFVAAMGRDMAELDATGPLLALLAAGRVRFEWDDQAKAVRWYPTGRAE